MESGQSEAAREEKPAARSLFPSTHWSVLKPVAQGDGDTEARRAGLEALARLYWRPVYAHFRLRWRQSREQAEDMTQDFFLWVLGSPMLERAEPGRGRFRNFVKTHLDNFMRNRLRAGRRLCRGGDRKALSLDFGDDPDEFLGEQEQMAPDEVIDYHWKQAVLTQALERLRRALEEEGRPRVFEVLQAYDLADSDESRPTYVELARRLAVSPRDIDNYLSQARGRLYQQIREIVAQSVDGPEALQEELGLFFPGGAP